MLAALILLLVGALVFMTGCSSPIQSSVAEKTSPEVTDAYLADAYTSYNARFFGGELPGDVVIGFSSDLGPDDMATTSLRAEGKFEIKFNRKFIRGYREANYTLLHEAAHVKTFGHEHDSVWQAEMIRLDRAGAFREILIDGWREEAGQ